MSARFHLACAAEGAYRAHSAAMLRSAIKNVGQGTPIVHYLHGPSFPALARRRIGRMVAGLHAEARFHAIAPELVRGLPVLPEFTEAMWYRVMLPELVPDADRVLYLDADTIVTDSLDPLGRLDLDGFLVAAVTNVLLDKHRHRPGQFGIETEAYFNSGVLLMNLDEMRRSGASGAILEYAASQGPALDWPDQDALNVVLGRRRLALHPRWNCMNALWLREGGETFSAEALSEALERPAIRHFEGPGDNKPWHADCRQPHYGVYFTHRRRTPWPLCRREGSPSARLRRLSRGLSRRRRGALSA